MREYFATKWQEEVTNTDVIFYSDTGYVDKLKLGDEMITYYYNKVMRTSQEPMAVEYKFSNIPLGNHLLTGIFDLIDSNGKVIDFKTGSTKPTKIEMALDHQLTFYSYAYRYIFNKEETGLSILNLKHQLELTTTRDESHYKKLELVLDAVEKSINYELFYKRDLGKECKGCFDLEACQGLSRESFKRRSYA
jgi:CRISPR/Cas system-associated exonuclease Cas4 (RecB family)